MKNFWIDLPRPFTVLAPLDGVSDVVFRQVITEIGKPDVLFTEFTMTDGLVSKGKEKVAERLLKTEEQAPVIAQIWGTKPEHFYAVAKDLQNRGFAGIDLNMGCPDRTVVRNGACSALIKNPNLAAEIIQATREGAPELPLSVKTRIGFEKENIDEWIGFLLKQNLPVLTVHLRTVRELSKVPAHWEKMEQIMQLRDKIAPETLIVGNGDIMSREEISEKYTKYGCEGFMIGRGIFSNPWLFNDKIELETITIDQRITLFLHHIELFEKQWSTNPLLDAPINEKKVGWQGSKNFALLKKFAKTYIQNFPEASILREKLMEAKTLEDLKESLQNIL